MTRKRKIRESADINTVARLAKRAVDLGLYDWAKNPRFTAAMDIESACDYYGIDADCLMSASDRDFVHDVSGIANAINRQRKDFSNDRHFSPRCARESYIRESEDDDINAIKNYYGCTKARAREISDIIDIDNLEDVAQGMRDAEHKGYVTEAMGVKNSEIYQDVKSWYLETYPGDSVAEGIDEDVTFYDCAVTLIREGDIYDILGVGDSIIREKVFEKLADILGVDYNSVYYLWRDGVNEVVKVMTRFYM